jgi:hypothetical protein
MRTVLLVSVLVARTLLPPKRTVSLSDLALPNRERLANDTVLE